MGGGLGLYITSQLQAHVGVYFMGYLIYSVKSHKRNFTSLRPLRSLGLGQLGLWLNLDPFRLLVLPFGIAFHHQRVIPSYHPIFLYFLITP